MKPTFPVLAGSFLAAALLAEPVGIVDGYGKTEWGQSLSAVKTAAVGGTVKPGRTSEEQLYVVPGEAPLQSTTYAFFADMLVSVQTLYRLPGAPAAGPDREGFEIVDDMLKAKYGADNPELATAGISITATPAADGTIAVYYENGAVFRRAEARLKQREAERRAAAAAERQQSPRFQAIKKSGLTNTL